MKTLILVALVSIACSGRGGPPGGHPPSGGGAPSGGAPSSAGGGPSLPADGGEGTDPVSLGGGHEGGAPSLPSDGGSPAAGDGGTPSVTDGGRPSEGGSGGSAECVPSDTTFDELCSGVELSGATVTVTGGWSPGTSYCAGDRVVGRLPGEQRCMTAVFTCHDPAACGSYGPDSDENLESYGALQSWQAGTWRTEYLSPEQSFVQCTGQGPGSCRRCAHDGC